MRINFHGSLDDISMGLEELITDIGLENDPGGFPVEVGRCGEGLKVELSEGRGLIEYKEKSDFFRALPHLAANMGKGPFKLYEKKCFDTVCVMVDASRNAVPTVESVKLLLRKMALMGLNMLMLYTEDTYEVPEQPYMGYMRGRYSFDELRQCDEYAFMLGIEMVPCIQTLAHLPRLLQWKCFGNISDTEDILLAGEPGTYRLIDELIKAASAPFRSKRIHIGMDEAHFIGLGKYLTLHGPESRFDILNNHLQKVVEIAGKYNLEPIIWSDMYFRLVNPSGDYAADEIPEEVIGKIPAAVQLVYWDYYNSDKEVYLRKLKQHEAMKKGTIFAGGIWTWNGTSVSYSKSLLTTFPAVEACRETGIKEVIVTLWGDDGAETDFFQALLGIQLYAELSYNPGRIHMELVKRRFRECTGGDSDAFLDLDKLDNINGNSLNKAAVNTSKLALYQDVMLGLFDSHFEGRDLSDYYAELADRFKAHASANNSWAYLFRPIALLCEILSLKANMGIKLKAAYDSGEKAILQVLLERIKQTRELMQELRKEYRELWLRDFKPFGFEVLDIRLGGVLARLEYAQARVEDYVRGRVNRLPELEEIRLPHDRALNTIEDGLCRFNRWHQTVTASYIGHNIP